MKLHLLHGPGRTGSRKKLLDLKQKFDPNNVVVFEGDINNQEVSSLLATLPMFSDERVIILENPDENFVLDSSLITHHSSLILWFDHEVSEKKPIMEWVRKNNGQILHFPESKEISVFPFLDYLGNRDKRAFWEMDKLKKAHYDSQYLITMIFYLLRNLIYTPETAKDFVKKKNSKMRDNFSREELVNLYKFILETDFKIKSGLIDEAQAEFMLVKEFTTAG